MNINLNQFGLTPQERIKSACQDLRLGKAIVLMDDPHRENEGDLIVAAELINEQSMAQLISDCSGIVCLALTDEKLKQLQLPQMVTDNSSKNNTAFTVSIEAKQGVSTGVSAADRVQTIKTAIAANAQPDDLAHPGHVFPLRAESEGVLARRGHTEGGIDLCLLAGLSPAAVLCELMHKDGTMLKGQQLVDYALSHQLVLLTIEDIVQVLLDEKSAVA
ncbi:3,4-dihydroxy-2-butanone-4-phosphate synthase [Thalassomonas viridans]|uniref:3,4-dihydroxy-2-butanone 4-phosphate synthase n=1 Tax=Thalassomonas viridans TaxID=137584 RepID=A0AAF0C7Y9_9GAMM|nr:3,4-dihydroxy-2-butanone-4-phosphate synthase [Thalassomonas viridans]WDE04198.1 3,4-dihydroxy-2-butanone-4-phosphate synthase [Thalassomonas viridans]